MSIRANPAHRGDGGGVRDGDRTVGEIASRNSRARHQRQLELLAVRAAELRERVDACQISFIDAVDLAYSAAQWAGLTETRAGDDAVQLILAAAFATALREVPAR